MGTLGIILTLLAAILIAALVLAEIFFIPGVGLLGLIGIGGFLGVGYYLITLGEVTWAIIFAVVAILFFVLGFVLLSRNKVIKRVALTETVDEVAGMLPDDLAVGEVGKAISRLTLAGTVRINGIIFEAESEDGFIDAGETVVITRIKQNKVFVARVVE